MHSAHLLKQYALVVDKIRSGKYPSRKVLMQLLEDHDCGVSSRTFDRILEKLRDMMGLDIQYDIKRDGYFIANDANGHASKFLNLLEIGRSAEALTRSVKESSDNLRHIHLGASQGLKGLHQVAPLLQAIKEQRAITFTHSNFSSGMQKEVVLQPLLIKEYDDRWYVYGWSELVEEMRTYGIDRISDLKVLDRRFKRDVLFNPAEQFDDIIGVTMSTRPLTYVRLQFTRFQSNYIKTLPWHHSQEVLEENDDYCIIQLCVRPNHELVQKILACTNQVKVLCPDELAEEVRELLEEMAGFYKAKG